MCVVTSWDVGTRTHAACVAAPLSRALILLSRGPSTSVPPASPRTGPPQPQLGKDDEKPKYSFGTWFAMLFTCGVATGLWYYTAESMWHYKKVRGTEKTNNQTTQTTPHV